MEEFGIVLLILGIIALILWIYAIYDIVKGSLGGSSSKILWLIVVIIFPIIGALLYLLIGRKSSADRPGDRTDPVDRRDRTGNL